MRLRTSAPPVAPHAFRLLCASRVLSVPERREPLLGVLSKTSPGDGTPAASPQAKHVFWAKMVGNGQQTAMVIGDSSLVLCENMTGQNLSVPDYLSGQYLVEPARQSVADAEELGIIARRRLTGIADFNVANRIALRYARDLHADDLKQSNFILVGAQEANPG
jgi:hypothetical protein